MELDGARLVKVKEEVDGRPYSALLLELENACILIISEGGLRLGTLAIAIPEGAPGSPAPTSAGILGHRHVMTARLLAERVASLFGRIAIVSIRAQGSDVEVGARALAVLKKVLEEGGRGEP